MTPVISLHGTSPQELIEQRIRASEAILRAMEALSETHPNSRDYAGHPSLYEADFAIYRERFRALDELRNALMGEAEKIYARMQN